MATYTLEQFRRKLERFARKQPRIAHNAVKAGAEMVRTEAVTKHLSGPKMSHGAGSKKNATLQPDSGRLRNSVSTRVQRSGGRIRGTVGTNLKYAAIHEFGGTIRPKTKKYLKFKAGGRWYSANQVTIPERPYLRPSLEKKRKAVLNLILRKLLEGYKRSG
jgi:phage gpG-like protein